MFEIPHSTGTAWGKFRGFDIFALRFCICIYDRKAGDEERRRRKRVVLTYRVKQQSMLKSNTDTTERK